MLTKHPLSNKYQSLFNKFNVNTHLRLSHFFGQAMQESSLKPRLENLNYSASGLQDNFKKYFPTVALAQQYARKPEAIANRAYANRMGNGSEASGDGWKYRGRGIFQITGKNNYAALTRYAQSLGMNVDYVKNPDLLLNEADSLIGALWYWNANGISQYADKDNCLAVSKIINLGNPNHKSMPNHYKERLAHTHKFKGVFKC